MSWLSTVGREWQRFSDPSDGGVNMSSLRKRPSGGNELSRRDWLAAGGVAAAGFVAHWGLGNQASGALLDAVARTAAAESDPAESDTDSDDERMRYGLVTYLWGQDWDLPTLIAKCEETGLLGVELRTTHAHGVEPSLDATARREVKQRFADSPVTCLGPGSNERYDNPDPAVVRTAIEATKGFLKLSHDIGSTGVKVKPDRFYDDVPREKTIAQIAASLNELGNFGADLGQQVRLEVHGQCAELPTIKAIMEQVESPAVRICWNSNPIDLTGDGLEANFQLVREYFGDTVHIHELDKDNYPWRTLFELLAESDYTGWLLLEAGNVPEDRVPALIRQRELFDDLLADVTQAAS